MKLLLSATALCLAALVALPAASPEPKLTASVAPPEFGLSLDDVDPELANVVRQFAPLDHTVDWVTAIQSRLGEPIRHGLNRGRIAVHAWYLPGIQSWLTVLAPLPPSRWTFDPIEPEVVAVAIDGSPRIEFLRPIGRATFARLVRGSPRRLPTADIWMFRDRLTADAMAAQGATATQLDTVVPGTDRIEIRR